MSVKRLLNDSAVQRFNGSTIQLLFIACICLAGILAIPSAHAASFYAATNGVIGGPGSIAAPWDLQFAITNNAVVVPGSTLYLRSGTYTHAPQNATAGGDPGWIFRVTLQGNSTNRIVIRSAPGEWARIDGGAAVNPIYANGRPTFQVGASGFSNIGSYIDLMELVFFSSSTESRNSGNDGSFPGDINRSDGPYLYGPGDRLINCIVHDTSAGPSCFGTSSHGQEFYGNLMFNCGWQGTANGHGHGFYAQGQVASGGLLKTVKRNIVAGSYQKGGQFYGSAAAQVSHFRWSENIWIGEPGVRGALQIGIKSGSPADMVIDNEFFSNYGYGASVEIGHFEYDPIAYADFRFADNYFVNGKLFVASFKALSLTNNVFIDPINFSFGNIDIFTPGTNGAFRTASLLPWNWDRNQYTFSAANYAGFIHEGVAFYNFTNWRAHTGYDLNSTISGAVPAGTNLIVLQNNIYNTNRAQVAIYNWTVNSSIVLDVSSLGWPQGVTVLIHNVQDYFNDIVATTVSAGQTITLNMLAAAHTVAVPYGDTAPIISKTFPNFGAFILESLGIEAPPPPVVTTLLTVNSSNPSLDVLIQMTPADVDGFSNGNTPFQRNCVSNSVTTLTAPLAAANGNAFLKWQRNGTDFATSLATSFTNSADTTMNAVFVGEVLTPGGRRVSATRPGLRY